MMSYIYIYISYRWWNQLLKRWTLEQALISIAELRLLSDNLANQQAVLNLTATDWLFQQKDSH